jgi:Uncharacterized protein conserved in bacteria
MSLSMYSASVPVLKQMLTALSEVLAKAEAHATEKKIDPAALLGARLFPDMFPLVRQVQIAADFAKGISSRLSNTEVPSWPDNPQAGFAELQELLTKALAHVGSFSAEQFEAANRAKSCCAPAHRRKRSCRATCTCCNTACRSSSST